MAVRNQYFQEDAVAGARARIPDGCVDLIVTDPPYGIDGGSLHKHYNRREDFVVDGYVEVPGAEYPAFTQAWIEQAARVLRPGGSLFLFSGWTRLRVVLEALAGSGLEEVNHLIWKYNFGVHTTRKFVSSHYHLLYWVKPGGPRTFHRFARHGGRERNERGGSALYADLEDVWTINREYQPGKVKNKNQLPTALLAKILQYASNPGDLVCDFFLGGFATACAAQGLDRDSTGFELNPTAFAHGLERLAAVERGALLAEVPTGADDSPPRAGRPFDPDEPARILAEVDRRVAAGATRRAAAEETAADFGRGYWSVEKLLKERRAAEREA